MVSPILELSNINKSFGHVHANKDINLTINKGTIHGIIGENGAGKSTLMSIVYGLYQADSGTIKVNDKVIKLKSPRESIENGIGMVHQHFMLVENFTVLENIVLGFEGEVVFGKNLEKAKIDLKNLCETYNLNVDLDSVISDLSVGFRQRVEILKSLYRGAEVFILDEPTGVLTPQEVDELFKILRSLKEEGKTIVLITHKLNEIMDLTSEVSVMRQGEIVGHTKTETTNREKLAEMMVGRSVLLRINKSKTQRGDVAFRVENLTVKDDLDVNLLNQTKKGFTPPGLTKWSTPPVIRTASSVTASSTSKDLGLSPTPKKNWSLSSVHFCSAVACRLLQKLITTPATCRPGSSASKKSPAS